MKQLWRQCGVELAKVIEMPIALGHHSKCTQSNKFSGGARALVSGTLTQHTGAACSMFVAVNRGRFLAAPVEFHLFALHCCSVAAGCEDPLLRAFLDGCSVDGILRDEAVANSEFGAQLEEMGFVMARPHEVHSAQAVSEDLPTGPTEVASTETAESAESSDWTSVCCKVDCSCPSLKAKIIIVQLI